ncbi:MAG: HD-GYP domain-containing protein, partial [Actinomycetota bacterium]
IVSVADAFDAMTSDRPYKRAMELESAVEEIRRCSGSQFDPAIVDVFLEARLDEWDVQDRRAG